MNVFLHCQKICHKICHLPALSQSRYLSTKCH